jgi:hypothetical protein
MAFMNQERKAQIAADLKKVMPKGWKYTLSVRHHSTIVLTISEAPIDLLGIRNKRVAESWERRGDKYTPETYAQVNEYHLQNEFEGELLATFQRIKAALNIGNHDRSDAMTDYFDVGWYVDIKLGRWDKPFKVSAPPAPTTPQEPTYEQLKARLAQLQAPKPIKHRTEEKLLESIAKLDPFQVHQHSQRGKGAPETCYCSSLPASSACDFCTGRRQAPQSNKPAEPIIWRCAPSEAIN